jgi:hypothetical protein
LWLTTGIAVVVMGLLLALWLVFDAVLEGPGPEYSTMVIRAALGCLAASAAIILALVGVSPGLMLSAATLAFVVAAGLCLRAQMLWVTWVPWYQAIPFVTTISLALALCSALLALARRWQRGAR